MLLASRVQWLTSAQLLCLAFWITILSQFQCPQHQCSFAVGEREAGSPLSIPVSTLAREVAQQPHLRVDVLESKFCIARLWEMIIGGRES